MDEGTRKQIVDRLMSRLNGISHLHEKDILSLPILGRQLLQLAGSKEAWLLACSVNDEEREAKRLLMRLGDPEQWRSDASESEDKRKSLLEERLCETLLSGGAPSEKVLDLLLDTASLPHFVGFVRDMAGSREVPKSSGGRVKVLD